MEPPWDVEPALFADKFWIIAKSDYLERWRRWYVRLPEDDRRSYEACHPEPSICNGNFYYVSVLPRHCPKARAEQHRDDNGDFAPPWRAFPEIGLGSIGWRMGDGEDYWHIFHDWYADLTAERKAAYKAKYPEPAQVAHGLPWTGFYERKERNG